MCLKKRQNAPGRVHVSAPTQVTKISPILCPPDPRPRDGGGTGGDRRTETQPLYHPSTPTACSASTGISTHSRAHAVTNPHTKGDVACESSQSWKRREVEPASHAAAVEGAAAAAEEVGVSIAEMEERKDVGILAMDIYFPPTCVQQVRR